MTVRNDRFFAEGQKYKNFEVLKIRQIIELRACLFELIHLPSGAKVMHIANEDMENLFCLSFQTLPYSSNGVAHILEHTVLCGSKKFPVKDPFFAMTRRSLNTFMNALTGSDFTCYPAASQVPKDFYNLLEVYLDAVFHPNLNYYNFLQEGHRLDFSQPDDLNSPLEINGIVFNEMKGAMASASSRMHQLLYTLLYPNLPYSHNSGGDPYVIPSLSYEELCSFHEQYYHPSRCLFFFCGNMPLEGHLDFINKHALTDIQKLPSLPPIPPQPRFTSPKSAVSYYPIAKDQSAEAEPLVAFGWLTCPLLDQDELLALSILEVILLDTDASPLKRAFLDSGLCKQVTSDLDGEVSEVPFYIILRGCAEESVEKLEALMRATLTEIANTGIPLASVENALHQLEFHRSEISHDRAPFGLSLFYRSALIQLHGADAEKGLMIHALIEQLHKRNLADPQYFGKLIRKHLLDNTHFVSIVMMPDSELSKRELEQEQALLSNIEQSLTQEMRKKIADDSAGLISFQRQQEEVDEEVLPKLHLRDINPLAPEISLRSEKVGNLTLFHHNDFTNEILYADLVYDLPYISEEELPLLRFFTVALPQMGSGGRSYSENLHFIQAHLGGISSSLTFNLQADNAAEMRPSIYISAKALHRKASKLCNILSDIAQSVDFSDGERLREVVVKHYTSLHSALQNNALRYALNMSSSGLDIPSKVANSWYGLDYYYAIKSIVDDIDTALPALQSKLQELKWRLLCIDNAHLLLSCDAALYDELKRHQLYGLTELPTKSSRPWQGDYSLTPVNTQGIEIASPVAFIGKVLKTVPYAHPDAPALNIAAHLCDNVVLHNKIREQGGAYGGGATCNSMSANFYFYSYRDPNLTSTLHAFEESLKTLAKGEFDGGDLEEAKFEMIQSLDTPISPGARADVAYGWLREGKTQALRQQFRTAILALTPEQVIAAIKLHLLPRFSSSTTIAFANRELLEKENRLLLEQGQPPLPIEKLK